MAVVRKKVSTKTEETKTTTPETKKASVKKTVKAPTVTNETEVVPATKVKAKKVTNVEGGKKLTLTGNRTPKTFEIKEGSQATQEAFIDKYYKKLQALGYDITKEQAKTLKKAYSETLKEVTDIASYQDTDANIFYARRYIKTRVTEPPKAKEGLKTLMNGHYELKVRKLLGDDSTFKFFGDLNEDGTVFITKDGVEIPLDEEVEVKPVTKKVTAKVAAKKVAPVVIEEELDDEEEVVEKEEDLVIEEEDEFDDDDLFDEDDE